MNDGGAASARQGHVAPVIPLFGGRAEAEEPVGSPSERHPARRAVQARSAPPRFRSLSEGGEAGRDETWRAPEDVLLRKLRAKPLSVSEARLVLRDGGADQAAAEAIIDDFTERGYLNDVTLAELLVRAGAERRGLGRAALARALAQRGIDRAIIDAALSELPDDDAERALEFARTKAHSLARLDREVAVRRLGGQLARRGYSSHALSIARQALDEITKPTSGVRFR